VTVGAELDTLPGDPTTSGEARILGELAQTQHSCVAPFQRIRKRGRGDGDDPRGA
jgi:hypothetical protein